jgi:SAM-dependent methyltransferase
MPPTLNSVLPDVFLRRLQMIGLEARLRRYGSRALKEVPASVERSADMDRIRRLWRRVRPFYRKDPNSAPKFARHPRFWLLLNAERAARAGLHEAAGLRVLDIGCGPGYFLAVARALGHECDGVDAPQSHLTPDERTVYAELLGALACSSSVAPLLVERFVPLPFRDRPYDLIASFLVCFNRHRQSDSWGLEEWRFFVEDAFGCLREGGRIFLDLNPDPERFGELLYYDEPTCAFFRSLGTVDGGRVLLRRPRAFSTASI